MRYFLVNSICFLLFYFAGEALAAPTQQTASKIQECEKIIDRLTKSLEKPASSLEEAVDYFNRGIAYECKSMLSEAEQDYTEAIKRQPPGYFFMLQNRASIYTRENKFDLAIADLDEAIRLAPDMANLYTVRGLTYSAAGNNAKARQDFETALQKDPNAKDVKEYLARLPAENPVKSEGDIGYLGFRCPENFANEKERKSATQSYFDWITKYHGDWTIEQVFDYRYQLLVSHQCSATLEHLKR